MKVEENTMTTQILAGQLTIKDGFNWFAQKIKTLGLSVIPDEDGVAILIERMRADVDNKLVDWEHSAAAVDVIQNLQDSTKGNLPEKRLYLAKLDAQGQKFGEQYKAASDDATKAELKKKMDNYSTEMTAVEVEIKSLEAELTERTETMNIRRQTHDKAALELKNFERMAPVLIEHTQALQEAQSEKMAALKKSQSTFSPEKVTAHLQDMLNHAQSDLNATVSLQKAEQTTDFDVKADLEKETTDASQPDRFAQWTK